MRAKVITGRIIDMDLWWRCLDDTQRDDMHALIARHLELKRPCIRLEYAPTGDRPSLRITYRIKNERGASLLDPSCTCGPAGRAIHLWDLTVDCELHEPLPDWWLAAA